MLVDADSNRVNILCVYLCSQTTRVNEQRALDFSETDFAQLVKTKLFVDKTWMIRQVFSRSSRILITAPPRFGKSTNIDMIKRFLEIEVDLTHKTKPVPATNNYKLFIENNLKICRDKEFFQEHFGKHPVVHVDFAPLSYARDFTDMLDALRTVISKSFEQHSYLAHADTSSSDTADVTTNNVFSVGNKCVIGSRKYYEKLVSSLLIRGVNASDLIDSFRYLSRICANTLVGKFLS